MIFAVSAMCGDRRWRQYSISRHVPKAQRRRHTRKSGQSLRQVVPEAEPSQFGSSRPAQAVPKLAVHLGRSYTEQRTDLERL